MIEITTNNVPRDLVSLHELTDDEQKEVDYVDFEEGYQRFFRYKGGLYDVQDCEVSTSITGIKDWDGYFSETFFSGVVFKYAKDSDWEQVIVGRYCAS